MGEHLLQHIHNQQRSFRAKVSRLGNGARKLHRLGPNRDLCGQVGKEPKAPATFLNVGMNNDRRQCHSLAIDGQGQRLTFPGLHVIHKRENRMEGMAIHGNNFVARLQTCILGRRVWTHLVDLDRTLRVLHEDPGLAQVVAHRIDVARQMNGRLHLGAIAIQRDGNSFVRTFTDEVVKPLVVRIWRMIKSRNDVAWLQTGLVGC